MPGGGGSVEATVGCKNFVRQDSWQKYHVLPSRSHESAVAGSTLIPQIGSIAKADDDEVGSLLSTFS